MSDKIQRSVLVTGASRNIGREIALTFARDGAFVLVHAGQDEAAAKDTADLVEQAGGKAAVAIGDLADPCLLYTSPSPRDRQKSRMPSSA